MPSRCNLACPPLSHAARTFSSSSKAKPENSYTFFLRRFACNNVHCPRVGKDYRLPCHRSGPSHVARHPSLPLLYARLRADIPHRARALEEEAVQRGQHLIVRLQLANQEVHCGKQVLDVFSEDQRAAGGEQL